MRIARIAGPLEAAAVSWVPPCGSRSRHLHVLHPTHCHFSLHPVLDSIFYKHQSGFLWLLPWVCSSSLILGPATSLLPGICTLPLALHAIIKFCLNHLWSIFFWFLLKSVGHLILLNVREICFDLSGVHLLLSFCKITWAHLTILKLMWQSERLQNGLQDSEGSGRPGKEDIRSPGDPAEQKLS